MIVFQIRCATGHEFEAWFRDSAAFDRQSAAGEVACPVCGETEVRKAIMAPRLAGTRKAEAPGDGKPGDGKSGDGKPGDGKPGDRQPGDADKARVVMEALKSVRRFVESNCDYVGNRFAEEARRIHYGETEHRHIYGESTPQEAKELKDEGVDVRTIPWVPRENS